MAALDPQVTEIIVVRHGETEWNADRRIQGQLDVMLNDVGRQQAILVAQRLSTEPKVSAVYSSDLKRASETADAIATKCGVQQVIRRPELRERHLGELQGLLYHEAVKTNPKAYQALSSRRTDQQIPGGGESLDQLFDRCTSALEQISQKHEVLTVLFPILLPQLSSSYNDSETRALAHLTLILKFPSKYICLSFLEFNNCMLMPHLSLPGERVVVVTHGGVISSLHERACANGSSKGKILNTSVHTFHLSYGHKWVLKSWGDVSHLDGLGFLQSGFGGDRTSG
ncbi:hypothetical protein ACFE04_022590 [Oxalis oulophora]